MIVDLIDVEILSKSNTYKIKIDIKWNRSIEGDLDFCFVAETERRNWIWAVVGEFSANFGLEHLTEGRASLALIGDLELDVSVSRNMDDDRNKIDLRARLTGDDEIRLGVGR